jgi:hypothetical protein
MSVESDKLRSMINSADEEIENIDSSIGAVDGQIDELQEEFNAIRNGLMTPVANDLLTYLGSTKILEIEALYGDCDLIVGPDYDDINVTDWTIIDATAITRYEYLGAGWDGDTIIIGYKNSWDFGYDYLYHSLGTSGTYGIQPMIDALNNGKSALNANKDTIFDSKTTFEDYAT